MSLQETLGSDQWLRENEEKVKALLPETWTHMGNLNGLQIGFGLKLLGIDWRSEDEFGRVMQFLEKARFMLRDGSTVKRNPQSVFRDYVRANLTKGTADEA
ncbi:hypothetical protein [Ottowia sp.]|uniref:hypothetical protein n=1 Tax=Ottowia sp. TaxID=1898956 RepID=UPI0025E7B2F1|nr:hypothetical protein [Ottowia sp.]MBK6616382.1 hypothetical protein [Ottowia sp.]